MAYRSIQFPRLRGRQISDPEWTRKCEASQGENVHEKEVSADYYIKRLGPTEEQAKKIREHYEREKKWAEEQEQPQSKTEKMPEEKSKP